MIFEGPYSFLNSLPLVPEPDEFFFLALKVTRDTLTVVMNIVQMSKLYCYKFDTNFFAQNFPSPCRFLLMFLFPFLNFVLFLSLLYSPLLFWGLGQCSRCQDWAAGWTIVK